METPDDIRCTVLMNLQVHDELPPQKKLIHLFRPPTPAERKSTMFNNSSGRYHAFPLDYSTIPSVVAAAEKFTEESKTFFANRDRKPWIRHGSELSFEVWVAPASEFEGKSTLPAKSFIVQDALTAELLEEALGPYRTEDTLAREVAAAEREEWLESITGNAMTLSGDTAICRPLTFKTPKKSISLYRRRNKSL